MSTTVVRPNLDNSIINMKLLREIAIQELKRIFDEVTPGKKILIVDPSLAGNIAQLVDIDWLKNSKYGIDRIFFLNDTPVKSDAQHYIYLLRPKVKLTRYIADHIHKIGQRVKYHIYFVPMRRLLCEIILQDAGVQIESGVKIGEYHLFNIPVEDDVINMDLTKDFKLCSLEGDQTPLFYTSKAIMQIQSALGLIPYIYGKGNNSMFIAETLDRMRKERAQEEQRINSEIDCLVLLDREVDLITPLCTQLTYEGIVDEVFGIFNSTVELPTEMATDPKAEKDPSDKKRVTVLMSGFGNLFAQIRDLNFSTVGKKLNDKATEIDKFYKDRTKAKSITEVNTVFKQLPNIQKEHACLRIHTNISEAVLGVTRDQAFRDRLEAEQRLLNAVEVYQSLQYIEECINKQEPLVKVLRVLALYSLTNDGFSEKIFNILRRDIVQTYGYKTLYTLENLTKLGMFKITKSKNNYPKLKNDLKLFFEDFKDEEMNDPAYVHSGYAPLSIRLIEKLISIKTFTNFEHPNEDDIIPKIIAPHLHKEDPKPWLLGWGDQPELKEVSKDQLIKECPGGPHFRVRQSPVGFKTKSDLAKGKKVVLIFFVGGCTFAEISAIRWLNKNHVPQPGKEGFSFVVGTTKLINGNSLIESITESFS